MTHNRKRAAVAPTETPPPKSARTGAREPAPAAAAPGDADTQDEVQLLTIAASHAKSAVDVADVSDKVTFRRLSAHAATANWKLARAVLSQAVEASEKATVDQKVPAAENVKVAEAKAEQAEAKAEQAEAKAEQAEAKAELEEAKAKLADAEQAKDAAKVGLATARVADLQKHVTALLLRQVQRPTGEDERANKRSGHGDNDPFTNEYGNIGWREVDDTVFLWSLVKEPMLMENASYRLSDHEKEAKLLVLKLDGWPLLKIDAEGKETLVIRPESRNLMDTVWDIAQENVKSKVESKFAIIGTPGIGKSCGLTYLLRLAVLAKLSVIYESRGTDSVFLYVPRQSIGNETDEYKVWRVPYGEWAAKGSIHDCKVLGRHKTVYLVDPAPEKASGQVVRYPKACRATTFLATSPNKMRYERWLAEHVFMDRWTPLELLAARHVMAPDMSDEMVRERIVIAGLAPRYVFNDQGFKMRERAVRYKSHELPESALNALLTTTLVDIAEDSVSSALLAYARSPVSDSEESQSKSEEETPQMKLKPYESSAFHTSFSSAYAVAMVAKHYGERLCSTLTLYRPVVGTLMGHLFEDIAIQVISTNPKLRVAELMKNGRGKPESMQLFGETVEQVDVTYSTKSEKEDWEAWEKVGSGHAIVPCSKTFPLVDLLMPAFHACQMTVQSEHSMSSSGLKKALDMMRSRGKMTVYFVVPTACFDGPNSFTRAQGLGRCHGAAADETARNLERVKQFVVEIGARSIVEALQKLTKNDGVLKFVRYSSSF